MWSNHRTWTAKCCSQWCLANSKNLCAVAASVQCQVLLSGPLTRAACRRNRPRASMVCSASFAISSSMVPTMPHGPAASQHAVV